MKICSDICPWTLSVPHSPQFSSNFVCFSEQVMSADKYICGQMATIVYIFSHPMEAIDCKRVTLTQIPVTF